MIRMMCLSFDIHIIYKYIMFTCWYKSLKENDLSHLYHKYVTPYRVRYFSSYWAPKGKQKKQSVYLIWKIKTINISVVLLFYNLSFCLKVKLYNNIKETFNKWHFQSYYGRFYLFLDTYIMPLCLDLILNA